MTPSEGIRVTFVGDIYLGQDPDGIWLSSELRDVLGQSDLVVGNQEGPITEHSCAVGGKCCIASGLTAARVLQDWGLDVVSLANNHMFDYGWEGFDQTRRALAESGIRHLGAGENLEEAQRPLVVEVKGTRMGFLAYSWEDVQTTCATASSYGCAPLDEELMVAQTRALAGRVDAVIVMPHWGFCDYVLPLPQQVQLAERLVASGAAAVVGHHSHVVQGIVENAGALVAYSVGNFLFADFVDRGRRTRVPASNHRGLALRLSFKDGKVRGCECVYTLLEGRQVRRDDSPARATEMRKLSAPLRSSDYPGQWRRYVRRRMIERILFWLNPENWHRIRKQTLASAWYMLRDVFRRG